MTGKESKYDCLIVDDEEALSKSTCEYFNLFGIVTAWAPSAVSCLEFLRENEPSLIMLDINLGGSSGFDFMREELKRARENERKAAQSKKELVASLSHDIKTPVASIKAVAELMIAKSPDSAGQLEIITAKADQIDLLITDMFHATLEELEQLKVDPRELPSTVLYELLQGADYERKIGPFKVPECLITADKARLQQVLDNIVSNSYKYAGTEISVKAFFEDCFLAVEIADVGPGVAPDELPLVFEKFYRGTNASHKSGVGLGLYIAKHLLNKMGGDIQCRQKAVGFTVKILLAM